MGYYTFAVGVRIKELQAAIGSNDQRLLERVRLGGYFSNYEDVVTDDGKFTLDKALQELIAGRISRPDAGFVYGYALICLSHALGYELPEGSDFKMYVETEFIDALLRGEFGLDDFDITDQLFPDACEWSEVIPQLPEVEDWPSGVYLPLEYLRTLQQRLAGVQITNDQIAAWENGEGTEDDDEDGGELGEEKACAAEHVRNLQANLAFCIEHELDMAWFCH